MDDAVACDGAAAVDRLFALEGGKPATRLADQDRRRTNIIGLDPRIDHGVRTAEENLPVAIEVGKPARRITCIGQSDQRVSYTAFGELLEAAVCHGRVREGGHLGHSNRGAIVSRAVALHGGKQIPGGRHVRDAGDRYAVCFDPDEDRPGGQPANEGSRSIDRINDESEPGVVAVSAGLLAEKLRLWIFVEHVITNRVLDFAIRRGDRAAIGFLFRRDTLPKVLHRSIASPDDHLLEPTQCSKSADAIDVEPLAHGRSMTCLTGSVKCRCCDAVAPFPIDACAFCLHDGLMGQGGSIVPFAGWRRTRLLGESPLRQAIRSVGDRVVRFAEEVVGQDIDARIAGIKTHPNEVGHDPFGFDPETSRYALAVAALLHRRYFRTQVFGIDRVPAGRVLIVANHSGQLPVDAVMIGSAMMLDANPPRFPRSMVETWTAELPFISTLYPRLGQVVGSPENARRLLEQEESLIVFPEGARGISKTFDQRYRLTDFGLGFVRLALETPSPSSAGKSSIPPSRTSSPWRACSRCRPFQ